MHISVCHYCSTVRLFDVVEATLQFWWFYKKFLCGLRVLCWDNISNKLNSRLWKGIQSMMHDYIRRYGITNVQISPLVVIIRLHHSLLPVDLSLTPLLSLVLHKQHMSGSAGVAGGLLDMHAHSRALGRRSLPSAWLINIQLVTPELAPEHTG